MKYKQTGEPSSAAGSTFGRGPSPEQGSELHGGLRWQKIGCVLGQLASRGTREKDRGAVQEEASNGLQRGQYRPRMGSEASEATQLHTQMGSVYALCVCTKFCSCFAIGAKMLSSFPAMSLRRPLLATSSIFGNLRQVTDHKPEDGKLQTATCSHLACYVFL